MRPRANVFEPAAPVTAAAPVFASTGHRLTRPAKKRLDRLRVFRVLGEGQQRLFPGHEELDRDLYWLLARQGEILDQRIHGDLVDLESGLLKL
jgi:hypothetical protein